MSSLGIFDKETKTYKKVADLSKPAVIDSSMSDSSTNAVQNKVVKSYVDSTFKRKSIAYMPGDGNTLYCRLCTIKINGRCVNTPIEITVQERGRDTLDRLTVLFDSVNNNDPNLINFKVFGEFDNWYISKRDASTWAIYGQKNEPWGNIGVVGYNGIDNVNVTWDVTGVTELPDSKTKAVWGGNVGHAVSADSANSALTVTNADTAMSDSSTNAVQNKVIKKYVDDHATNITVDDDLSPISTNPVQNKVITSNLTDIRKETTVNLLNPTLQTTTQSGVTCTNNGDGTYTLNGTATDGFTFELCEVNLNKFIHKTCLLIDCGKAANSSGEASGNPLGLIVKETTNWTWVTANDSNDYKVILDEYYYTKNVSVRIEGVKGDSYNNAIVKPMLTTDLNATYDDFVPYTGDTGRLNGDVAELNKTVDTLKKSVSDGKTNVANAITAKGVTTATDATFATMANNISKIETGVDTSDATATAAQILTGKTAYVKGSKVTGTLGTKNDDITRSTPTALSTARYDLAGASVGNYALFAGGYNGSNSGIVDAYDSSLTRSTTSSLSDRKRKLAGASVGNYALFAGGDAGSYSGTVDAYNSSLTISTPSSLSDRRSNLAGASVGNYALFAGGYNGSISGTVDAYNSSLIRSTPSSLSVRRNNLAGASVGNYALFAGGYAGGDSVTVDAYDSSLTRNTPTALSTARYELAGASVGNYALFAGGYAGGESGTVDAYDSSLTRSTPTALSTARYELAGASVGNYALFAGGCTSTWIQTVDAYDSSLTRSTPTALSTARYELAGASVGNYALFAGGYAGGDSGTVDAYEPPHIYIPAQTIYL